MGPLEIAFIVVKFDFSCNRARAAIRCRKVLVVQRIERLTPNESIEVQLLARAQLRARFKGTWFLTRADDLVTHLARAQFRN